jgi:hypothetical protein
MALEHPFAPKAQLNGQLALRAGSETLIVSSCEASCRRET